MKPGIDERHLGPRTAPISKKEPLNEMKPDSQEVDVVEAGGYPTDENRDLNGGHGAIRHGINDEDKPSHTTALSSTRSPEKDLLGTSSLTAPSEQAIEHESYNVTVVETMEWQNRPSTECHHCNHNHSQVRNIDSAKSSAETAQLPASQLPASSELLKLDGNIYVRLHQPNSPLYIEFLEKQIAELRREIEDQRQDTDGTTETSKTGSTSGDSVCDKEAGDEDQQQEISLYREIKYRLGYQVNYREDDGDEAILKEYMDGLPRHAITHRRTFDASGRHVKTQLLINSHLLIDLLKQCLSPSRTKHYQKLYSQKVKFSKPYVPLFQSRRLLLDAMHSTQGEKAPLLALLLDFLKEDMKGTWAKLDEIEKGTCERISFEDAWLLYPPGTTVFHKSEGRWAAFKVETVHISQSPVFNTMKLRCYNLGFKNEGSALKPVMRQLELEPFAGERPISDLAIIPQSHIDAFKGHSVPELLIARGHRFWGLGGTQAEYREYVGTAWPTTLPSDSVRVIVDYATSSRPTGEEFDEEFVDDVEVADDEVCTCGLCVRKYAGLAPYPPDIHDESDICPQDQWPEKLPFIKQQKQYGPGAKSDAKDGTWTEDPLIFCPGRAWAFSLKQKSWKHVEVEKLDAVRTPRDPFKDLVLDDDYKMVVESLVDTYLGGSIFSDIVRDKGRGLVVLLHGGPGTGKTLTAECVAEKKKRPLYMVTCGDLGTDAQQLEDKLRDIFLDAVNWKAVVLLDEADVFLQERDLYDLGRNALVSVFLRHIEYYDGLLFLTTNRPGQIDEAFQSRIHVTLGLPNLDAERQKKVWLIFIRTLRLDEAKDVDRRKKIELLDFVQNDLIPGLRSSMSAMNGRQIRNCIRAACAIASKQGRVVDKGDIQKVMDLGTKFQDYMTQVNRMNQDEKARALGLRLLNPS